MSQGIDAYRYMQMASHRLSELNTRQEVEKMLDELEYLYEVLDPEFMDLADTVISSYRNKLSDLPC